jgi:hypothetical protein
LGEKVSQGHRHGSLKGLSLYLFTRHFDTCAREHQGRVPILLRTGAGALSGRDF